MPGVALKNLFLFGHSYEFQLPESLIRVGGELANVMDGINVDNDWTDLDIRITGSWVVRRW